MGFKSPEKIAETEKKLDEAFKATLARVRMELSTAIELERRETMRKKIAPRYLYVRAPGSTETAAIKRIVKRIKRQGIEEFSLGFRSNISAVRSRLVKELNIYYGCDLDRLTKRVFKKTRQPYRKNMNRKAMKRRAAGKNEVTRRV